MAVRIAGTNVPGNKRIEYALTAIYGIGLSLSCRILKEQNIKPGEKLKDLPEHQINNLRNFIEKNFKIEGDLKRTVQQNIKRLKDIKSYRGSRHIKRLPARGQRTRTNTRTLRGNVRVTMGSGKRKAEKK